MQNDPVIPRFAMQSVNLASPRLGAQVSSASDEFFADKSRMISDTPARFIADRYDEHGKWMDGWETRRRRDGKHDWCLVQLGVAGHVRGVDIDTSHFTGNYPPAASIDACLSIAAPGEDAEWVEILPASTLGPSAHHYLEVTTPGPWNWLRLNIYPDGGVARLRVFGDPVPRWNPTDTDTVFELSALSNGGNIVAYNDAHYGGVWSVLTPGRGVDMGDGWETRRRREPGHDWLIVSLGALGRISALEVDTAHFKGNYPDRCSVQAAKLDWGTPDSIVTQAMFWPELMPSQPLSADNLQVFEGTCLRTLGPVSHVKLNIIPDGGISRFRVFGKLAR